MSSSRRRIAVIDAETDPFLHGRIPRPFLWGFYDGERYETFTDADALVDWLETQRLIVYAHNGGRFDYHFFFDRIEEGTEITVINGRIAKFKIGECEFRDSYNLLPVPLAQMQKDEVDYSIFEESERNKPGNRKIIADYLKSDCVYLWNWITQFIEEYGLHLTTAGTAMKKWSAISGRKPPRDVDGVLYRELSPYYYGGRCEAWHYGELTGDFKLADINSAYPFAMLHKHPISTDCYYGSGADEWRSLPADVRSCSFLTVRGKARGCFPFRMPDGSLVFPDDDIERVYKVTGWEYEAALRTKTFKCREIADFTYFEELIDFADYVDYFYQMKARAKAEDNKPAYTFAKLLMNALYGKFGSNPQEYREYMAAGWWQIDENGEAGEWTFNCALGGETDPVIVSRPQPDERRKFYNIATAASITGFVRAYLWEAICKCDGVLYCDTDSIVARDVSALVYSDRLGDWELEGTFDYGAFGGKKMYALHYKGKPKRFDSRDRATWRNWKIASKGIRATPDDLRRIARGETAVYVPDAPTFSVSRPPSFVQRVVKMRSKKVAQ